MLLPHALWQMITPPRQQFHIRTGILHIKTTILKRIPISWSVSYTDAFPHDLTGVSENGGVHRFRGILNWGSEGFLKVGVPIVIDFNRMNHYKPSILGSPHLWKPPNDDGASNSEGFPMARKAFAHLAVY